MGKICAFFGHRTAPYFLYENKHIQKAIISLIEREKVDVFWFGGNGDFDRYANYAAQEVQKDYPRIKRVLVVPYQRQLYPEINPEYNNPTSDDEDFIDKFGFDSVIFPEELLNIPKRFAIVHRNRFEIENADFFICYIICNYGGAYKAFKRAKRCNRQVINLADDNDVKCSTEEHEKELEKLKKIYGDKPEYVKIFNDKT